MEYFIKSSYIKMKKLSKLPLSKKKSQSEGRNMYTYDWQRAPIQTFHIICIINYVHNPRGGGWGAGTRQRKQQPVSGVCACVYVQVHVWR